MSTSSSAGHQRLWATILMTLVLAAIARIGVAAPVTWQSWGFDYDVSGNMDGLSLRNVTFQGRPLITKLSLPVMRVFYDSDACGPYADRLGGTLSPIPWASNATLAQREFTLNGQQWYEIGIRDQIGSYDIYQVYYLSADGTIDAHIYSKGLQCVVNHIHYPDWRVDFGLDGVAEDQILRDTGSGFAVLTQEFDSNVTSANNHAWRVRDSTTGLSVDVLPGFPDFVIPDGSTTVPVTTYSNNMVFGRVYRGTEDTGWTYGPNTQVPFNNGESLATADTVLWYEAYLPHSSSEGSALWHSTGIRLVANLSGTPPPPPPPPPGSEGTTFVGGAVSILDNQPGAPYPSTVDVTNLSGTITKVTVRLDGFSHTYPDDVDIALVGPGGQAVMLMSDAGGSADLNGVALTFDASAAATLPDGSQISGGVFRPVNYGATDAFAAPAPGGTYGTSLDVFNGLAPNGAWQLYVVDDAGADVGSIGSWALTVTTTSTTPPLPDSTPDAFTFTDVTGVPLGTVQISNTVTITGINTAAPISVVGGEYSIGCGATFTAATGTISNGQTVCVRHTSAATNAASTSTTLTVGGVGDTYTSTTLTTSPPPGTGETQSFTGGAVSIRDNQPGAPYPSTVSVSNMGGAIAKVTIRLDGLSHTYPDDVDIALVGPGGQAVMLMSDAGGGGDINGMSLTFDSSAFVALPYASQLSGGVFRPVNYDGTADAFAAPAPGGTYGTSLDVFNGLAPNGAWRLYVVDDGSYDVGNIGSWVLTVTTTSTAPPPDSTPEAFTFTDVTGAIPGTVQISNTVTITGINTAAPISVVGGEYSIGCGATFTAATGTISNGQTVCVRHTSAASNGTSTDTTLTVGGVGDTFTSTTSTAPPPPDVTPEAFTFNDVSGVALGVPLISNAVTITGINTAAPVSVTGGEYSVGCGATFTAAIGTISNGQTVCVRHTSAASNGTSTDTTLTVSGVGDTFTSTTALAGSGQTQAFAGGAVAIADYQPGAPYPSSINVAGMGGTISKVMVRLDGLSHTYPDDLDIALVGPGGQAVMLMSDAGGSADVNSVSLTFDSSATSTLPNASQISGGLFQPVNYGASDAFAAPAPGGNYGTSLNAFNGQAPNGTWRLYVVDDQATDVGALGAGWVLTITTQ